MSRDETNLRDILQAAKQVMEFTRDMESESFLNDRKTQSAVLHELMVVGEAVKRLSEDFRAEHPQVPWKQMAGMRDKLIHNYNDVDLDEVWATASKDIPALIALIEPLTSQE